jgi:hypothetical protein
MKRPSGIAFRLVLVALVLSTMVRAIAPLDVRDHSSTKRSGKVQSVCGQGQIPFCVWSESRLLAKLGRPDRTKFVWLGLQLHLQPRGLVLVSGHTARHAANLTWHDLTLETLQTDFVRLQV